MQTRLFPNSDILCLYGDPEALKDHSYGAGSIPIQGKWNQAIRKIRINFEWIFGYVKYFKFLNFKKDLKLHLIVIRKMYLNAPTLIYGNETSTYFGYEPFIITYCFQ